MTSLFLVRHGEVAGNRPDAATYVGWGDNPLTARGELQAQAIAARLQEEKLDAVYASDLQRAHRTAEHIAAKCGLKVLVDPDWREVCYGAWEGLSESEVRARWPDLFAARRRDPWTLVPPEGESYAQAWTRWERALQRVVEAHPSGRVCVVAHGGALRFLPCHFLGMPWDNYRRIRIDNASLSWCEQQEHEGALQWQIRALNETDYLKGI